MPVCAAVWLLFCSSPAFSFGADGHRIIVLIAENHISDKTSRAIAEIIDGADLGKLSLWPDSIRRLPAWEKSKHWHYINIDDNQQFSNLERSTEGDLLSALQSFSTQLQNPQLSHRRQVEALAFITHLVADIHQPLHVGRRDDRGGNNIEVKWLKSSKPTNLHQVWDSLIIDTSNKSPQQYAIYLDRATNRQVALWQQTGFLDWAKESKALRDQVYDFSPQLQGKRRIVTTGYVERNKPIVERQLLIAGIRLAGCLDAIFNPQGL